MAKRQKKSSSAGISNQSVKNETDEWRPHIYPRPVDKEIEVVDAPYFSTDDEDEPKKNTQKTSASEAENSGTPHILVSNRGWLFLAICIGLFVWEWIDASRYVEVPATVMGVSVKPRAVPIFGSKYNAGGSAMFIERWAELQYYFEDVEYNAKLLMHSEVTSAYLMVFCKKSHPAECRSTKLKYPIANIFLILLTWCLLMFVFGAELLESIFKSEYMSLLVGFCMFVGLLAYLYYRFKNL